MTPARRCAFQTLLAVERGALASNTLDELSKSLDPRDAGLAAEIVFGVLRRRIQLQFLIAQKTSKSLQSLDLEVRLALEIGAYQLRFLERIPTHSAVTESVDLVKRARKISAAGFVNAILRNLPPLPDTWPDRATRLCMPQWLLDRWTQQFGGDADRIAEAFLRRAETYVRMAGPAEGLESTEVPGCYHVTGDVPPDARIMDLSSQSIVPLLDLQPGHCFLDLCAAPGNKTAQALEVPLQIAVACDASPRRVSEMRLRIPGLRAVRLDATAPLPFRAIFDRILVDAPCSGTGTLGRNPEIKWRLTREEIRRHARRQRDILRDALACLKPGGRLVYSTCSLEPEENEEVVHDVAPGRVQLTTARLPGRDAGDGFKAAVLT